MSHIVSDWPYPVTVLPAIASVGRGYYECKRLMDLLIATIALVVLSPLLLLIALVIKLDSPGPVFFCQKRVGSRRLTRDGHTIWEVRIFPVYKFRSMVHHADESLHRQYIKAFVADQVVATDDGRAKYKLTNDPRLTRSGRLLRRFSLDELPQLFNVLKGEMSVIGPRPVPEYEVAEYREAWRFERLAALPGITGLWQVTARCDVRFDEMIRLDVEYIHRQSFWLDLKILLLTIPAVISGAGAE